MTSTYVNWGGGKIKLTWYRDHQVPEHNLITSVHGFCFHNKKLLLVDLNHRGLDFPGGHIELNETPEACFKREVMEEGCVERDCHQLGYIVVDHTENHSWSEDSPYPKVGYQVFYRMDVKQIYPFEGKYESTQRTFINPYNIAAYYDDWHILYQEILDLALDSSE